MKHAACVLLFLLWPIPGQAESVYRCVDVRGHASYQSSACANGTRQDRVIEFSRVEPVAPRRASRSSRSASASGRAQYVSTQRHGRRRGAAENACDRAKAKRQQQLARLGLKRTYDDLSRIDASVWIACHGG
jgi:hypothetical protein